MRLDEVLTPQELEEIDLKKIGKGVAAAGLAGALAMGSPDVKANPAGFNWDSLPEPYVATAQEKQELSTLADKIIQKYYLDRTPGKTAYRANFKEILLQGTPEQILMNLLTKKLTQEMQNRRRAQMKAKILMMQYLIDNKPNHPAIK